MGARSSRLGLSYCLLSKSRMGDGRSNQSEHVISWKIRNVERYFQLIDSAVLQGRTEFPIKKCECPVVCVVFNFDAYHCRLRSLALLTDKHPCDQIEICAVIDRRLQEIQRWICC